MPQNRGADVSASHAVIAENQKLALIDKLDKDEEEFQKKREEKQKRDEEERVKQEIQKELDCAEISNMIERANDEYRMHLIWVENQRFYSGKTYLDNGGKLDDEGNLPLAMKEEIRRKIHSDMALVGRVSIKEEPTQEAIDEWLARVDYMAEVGAMKRAREKKAEAEEMIRKFKEKWGFIPEDEEGI